MANRSEEIFTCTDGAASKLSDFAERFGLNGLDDGQDNGVNQALAGMISSKENIEPIIIGNYRTMNYFSQAASDVTIYLNTEENFDGQSSCCSVENNMIDLTKPLEQVFQNPSNGFCEDFRGSIAGTLDLKPFTYPQVKEEIDIPEYIDINKLQVPIECILYPRTAPRMKTSVPPFLKRKKRTKRKPATITTADDDNDVIFVREYQAGDEERFRNPLDLSAAKKGSQFKPRRNPKRQVQLMRASTDVVQKPSDTDIYYDMSRNSFEDYDMEVNSFLPDYTSGAIFNPPFELTDCDFKEWPAEGMHEKPAFDYATKKIEKIATRKPRKGPAKGKEAAKPFPRKRKIVRKIQKAKKADTSGTNGINQEFAAFTHRMLQEVIDYVLRVKEYNDIIKFGENPEDEGDEDKISKHDKCLVTITEVINGKRKEKNLKDATQILVDSCLLYSLANGVCTEDVARYLENYKDEGLPKE